MQPFASLVSIMEDKMVKRTIRKAVTQNPIPPTIDLRDMVRQHLISRGLICMEKAAKRRRHFLKSGQIEKYKQKVCVAVRNFYGKLPVAENGASLQVIQVSSFEKNGYRLKNILFDSFPGWGGIDRYMAYASAALGDSVMAMRIRDGLASLKYLRSRSEVDSDKIIISGCGLGGIVALHLAAIDGKVHGVVVWDCLVSFKFLLEAETYTWPADTFIPNVLLHYDLPELVAALPMSSLVLRPLDGTGAPVSLAFLSRLN